MRWISVTLSVLTFPLLFLLLPALIFPPLALVTAGISYVRARRNAGAQWNVGWALLNLLPVLLALAAWALAWWILSTQYRA